MYGSRDPRDGQAGGQRAQPGGEARATGSNHDGHRDGRGHVARREGALGSVRNTWGRSMAGAGAQTGEEGTQPIAEEVDSAHADERPRGRASPAAAAGRDEQQEQNGRFRTVAGQGGDGAIESRVVGEDPPQQSRELAVEAEEELP